MSIIKGTKANFSEEVNKNKKVIVDFFATWCGPCKMLSPVLESVSEEMKVDIIKVDIDQEEELANEFEIMAVPTLLIMEKGNVVNKHVGFIDEGELKSLL